jgi:cyanate lyase
LCSRKAIGGKLPSGALVGDARAAQLGEQTLRRAFSGLARLAAGDALTANGVARPLQSHFSQRRIEAHIRPAGTPATRRRSARAGAGLGRQRRANYQGRHLGINNQQPQRSNVAMKRSDLTEKILDIKREKGWTWKAITDQIGGMSPVLVVGALLGQQKPVKPLAAKAGKLFGLTPAETAMLNEVPYRGGGTPMPPTDPLIYRFYELVMVNAPAWKALIEEEFGDGIMSAIDFDMDIERLPNPKGDRVKLTMSGKFLPYKYYGSEQGLPEYGFKEE